VNWIQRDGQEVEQEGIMEWVGRKEGKVGRGDGGKTRAAYGSLESARLVECSSCSSSVVGGARAIDGTREQRRARLQEHAVSQRLLTCLPKALSQSAATIKQGATTRALVMQVLQAGWRAFAPSVSSGSAKKSSHAAADTYSERVQQREVTTRRPQGSWRASAAAERRGRGSG
jgi:hypothetical protein